jgi:hypothetical protein
MLRTLSVFVFAVWVLGSEPAVSLCAAGGQHLSILEYPNEGCGGEGSVSQHLLNRDSRRTAVVIISERDASTRVNKREPVTVGPQGDVPLGCKSKTVTWFPSKVVWK